MTNTKAIEMNVVEMNEAELAQVNGGSIWLKEADGKAAGLTLMKEDGSAGSWGYLWNTGDYYWRGQKLSNQEARSVSFFTKHCGHQPGSVAEAIRFYDDEQARRADSY